MDKINRMKKAFKAFTEKINIHIKSIFALAGEHKQKLLKISGTAAGIIVCSVLVATLFTPGYEVYLDGEKVAVVSDKAVFEKAFDEANEEIVSIAGKGYGITKIPKYVFTIAAKMQLTGEHQIKTSVMAKSDAVSEVYVINVDGQDIAYAQSKEEAEALLEKAASTYDGENRQILNNIEIENRFEAVRYLYDENEAVKKLINVLIVQTEKTETYEAELLYGRTINQTEDMYLNEEEILFEGENGAMEVMAKVTSVNGVTSKAETISTKVIKEPVSEVVMVGITELPSVGTGIFQQPFYGTITSRFGARWGRTHTGTDIAGETGSPIKAADNGVVITAEYQDNGYGNIVIIDHQNGIHTWYAHLNAINVAEGAVVEKGTVIGELGNTGYSTGPHLHFEVRENGTPVDPAGYLEDLQ